MPTQASPPSIDSMSADHAVTWRQWAVASAVGFALSFLMWHGLLQDHGLVGGDTWPYFFPQKMVLAESLARNELPLWHDLTGLGYPLLAESQAGVFYPSNQILYRILDVNRAYYFSIFLHYALAFVLTWRFARCQRVSSWSSLLVALVFVYGWFPSRISLEWSIIGGVWLPLTLWLTHEFLAQPSRWRFALLTSCLAIHLLAGHFTLAFINQLCLLFYAGLQIVLRRAEDRPSVKVVAAVPAAILLSLALSAAQLVPSMELKQVSQRDGARSQFDPGYGHMPPIYLTQLVASWTWWHSSEIVESRQILRLPGSIASDTNQVEAHFYLGLIPLGLAAVCLLSASRLRFPKVARRSWMILGAAAILYATGWLLPVTRHLPGFAYFMGPGRYTIVATLAGAILSGFALDALFRNRRLLGVAVVIIGVLTWQDLKWSNGVFTWQELESRERAVADGILVPEILSHQRESWVREYFLQQPARSCRLLASGPNVGNLFGVSCVPQYLGIGPAVYFGDRFDLVTQPDKTDFVSAEQVTRLQNLGVTHVLTTERATGFDSALTLVGAQPDALLNRIWARGSNPCYLYELKQPGQRLGTQPSEALTSWKTVQQTPEDIVFDVSLSEAAQVDLKELMYPGWKAEIDGQSVDHISGNDLTRSVQMSAGNHTLRWRFESSTVQLGMWISSLTFIVLWISPLIPLRHSQTQKQQI